MYKVLIVILCGSLHILFGTISTPTFNEVISTSHTYVQEISHKGKCALWANLELGLDIENETEDDAQDCFDDAPDALGNVLPQCAINVAPFRSINNLFTTVNYYPLVALHILYCRFLC